jgi:hypothetical protein
MKTTGHTFGAKTMNATTRTEYVREFDAAVRECDRLHADLRANVDDEAGDLPSRCADAAERLRDAAADLREFDAAWVQ